jgi:hypothetical protein
MKARKVRAGTVQLRWKAPRVFAGSKRIVQLAPNFSRNQATTHPDKKIEMGKAISHRPPGAQGRDCLISEFECCDPTKNSRSISKKTEGPPERRIDSFAA